MTVEQWAIILAVALVGAGLCATFFVRAQEQELRFYREENKYLLQLLSDRNEAVARWTTLANAYEAALRRTETNEVNGADGVQDEEA